MPLADVIFEHRLYLPSIGIFAAMAAVGFYISEKLSYQWPLARGAAIAAAVAVVLALSTASYARNTVWQSPVSLWEESARKSPGKARAHFNLGVEYDSLGLLEKARKKYHDALDVDQGQVDAHFNLGLVYKKLGRMDKAIHHYSSAVKLRPEAETLNNLAVAYAQTGRMDKAISNFSKALRLRPDFPQAHFNLGVGYYDMGYFERAKESFKTAIDADPALGLRARPYLLHLSEEHDIR